MYQPTNLEKWVSDKLIKMNIMYPWELKPRLVAQAFDIDFEIMKSPAVSGEEFGEAYIIVDARKDPLTQREQFFHELGHVLRHYGNQNCMNDAFRLKQEWDANLFAMYAMIPYHMLDFTQQYTEDTLIERFKVPMHIARSRIRQICQKIFQTKKSTERVIESNSFNVNKYSIETKRLLTQLSRQIGATFR